MAKAGEARREVGLTADRRRAGPANEPKVSELAGKVELCADADDPKVLRASTLASSSAREASTATAEQEALRWLRRSYWAGAAVDALATLIWLGVGRVREPAAIRPSFDVQSAELRYGLRCGAALMAGWTALLLWADRAPLERRGVLPLTIVPVIAGLAVTDTAALRAGQLPRARVLPVRAVQASLAGVMAYSYAKAARVTRCRRAA